MRASRRIAAALVAVLVAELGTASGATEHEPVGYALACGRVLTLDARDRVVEGGMLLVRGGVIEHVGASVAVPDGYELVERRDCWAVPGMIDLHSHVHGDGWGDLNDMVLPINADLRSSPALVPSNENVRRACAAGVTTLFGIPGSGTSLSGFGVLYKTKTRAGYSEVVLRDPGGMKVAQTHNPERQAGDLGRTRAGLYWLLADINDKAVASLEQGRFTPELENLERVHARELPVLIHCAGGHGVANTVRMWKGEYDTRCTVSHGCFSGYKVARYVAEMGVPVNIGPRTMDWFTTRDSRFVGIADVYVKAGVPDFSLNTDAAVIPEEELFLQGSMSARLGADSYQMLRAVTIHPARSFAMDDRVGSLEVGKDADVVLWTGDPLDPRSRVEVVWIDGAIQYDRARDGQWF